MHFWITQLGAIATGVGTTLGVKYVSDAIQGLTKEEKKARRLMHKRQKAALKYGLTIPTLEPQPQPDTS